MVHEALGKHYREDITLTDMFNMFPNNDAATSWFENVVWEESSFRG